MPIIIDNFFVNTDLPIDNRFVVGGVDSFYQHKEDIVNYKYLGLRIWDLNDNIPYYWAGTVSGWLSENSVGVLSDSSATNGAEVNYLSRFTTGPTTIGKSLLYQTPGTNQIGIGISNVTLINPNTDLSSNSIFGNIGGLHTNGNIKTNGFLIGKADYITQLNVSNVNAGLLDIRYVSHLQSGGLGSSVSPGQQYVLSNTATPNGVTWLLADTLSVLNSTNTTKVNVVSETTSTNQFITFVQGTGNVPVKINSSKIQFKPSNGQLFLSDGSATEPIYSFLNSTNTGIYYTQGNQGGISTTIQGNEVTSIRTYGLVVNNRIYVQVSSNNTDVGNGIVWLANGPSNDININDGFVYNGQRLNFYGLGSHIPDNTNTQSTLAGRGTYIAGYFGIDLFSGGRIKMKIDEFNDTSIFSRLNVNTNGASGNFDILGNSTNNNRVLFTMQNSGGSAGNNVVIKDWSVRSPLLSNATTQDSWLTWKHHNAITVDGVWATPNGPDTGQVAASGTLTFWERHPYIHEQYFGSVDRKTLTINSSTSGFVKVSGNIYNVTGNSFIGTYSVVSTKTIEDILNNNLPKTIKTGMFDINGTSMYKATPESNGWFTNMPISDYAFLDYTRWIEIPYNSPELAPVPPSSPPTYYYSYNSNVGANPPTTPGSHESVTNHNYNGLGATWYAPYIGTGPFKGVTPISGRGKYDGYGTRNSFQQGWHNIKGYKVFTIHQRDDSASSRFKIVMYKDPAYLADFNSGKLTEWKLEKNVSGTSVVYGGIGNGGNYHNLLLCPSFFPIPSFFTNQPGMSHVEIYIYEGSGEYQDVALLVNLQRRGISVSPIMDTNLPGVSIGTYTGI
jgi:hypothetical protein